MIFDPASDLKACIQKVERLSNCIEIANLINSELSIGRLLTHVMETTKKAFGADSVSLLLLDEETGDLTFQIALGDVGDEIKEIFRIQKGKGIAGHVACTGTPQNLADAYQHPAFSPDYDKKTGYRTRAMLCVPMIVRGKTMGVIQVMNKLAFPHVFTDEELDMLVTIASSAAVAIDTAKLHRIILQKETLERDLKLAREVQQSFIPPEPPEHSGYEFAGLNRPALEIGGDFYNFFPLQDKRLGIVLGDVSGKGVSAALFMARLTSDLQYHALLFADPADLLAKINRLLFKRAQHGMFVTLVYMVLALETRELTWSNAGHLPPVLGTGQAVELLGDDGVKGLPLGILPDIQYVSETVILGPEDRILVCTDGITEAKDSSGDLFGMERLMTEIGQAGNQAPDKVIRWVVDAVERFSQGEAPGDDLTLLNFRVNTGFPASQDIHEI